MIPDFKFIWKQLDGPNATWMFTGIYNYFKELFKPAIDHLNELGIDNMILEELKTAGCINSIPYPIVKTNILPDKYFKIYEDAEYVDPHAINSWQNVIQNFPVYNTLAELQEDVDNIADGTISGGTVVKCLEDNMFYQVTITMNDDVPEGSINQIGQIMTDTLITVSTTDYSDVKICRYFGEYTAQTLVHFIESMGSYLQDGDIISYGGKYQVYDTDSFKPFASVAAFENYDDTIYPGGMLISDKGLLSAYDYVGIGTEAYRVLLKGLLNSDAEIGSLRSLEDIVSLIIQNDSGSDNVAYRFTIKILTEPDASIDSTYGDAVLNIGQQFQWKNIEFWRSVLEEFISNMYNYVPKITINEEQIVANTYSGAYHYDGDIDYFYI